MTPWIERRQDVEVCMAACLRFEFLTIFHEICTKKFLCWFFIYFKQFVKLGLLIERIKFGMCFGCDWWYYLLIRFGFLFLIGMGIIKIDIFLYRVAHFLSLSFTFPAHFEHIYCKFNYSIFVYLFLSLYDDLNQLVSQFFCLRVTILRLRGAYHIFFAPFLLCDQQYFTNQLVV